ncbi:glycoside hydrolase family 43 protein [Cohnella nanjingensis]|uniref:Family 43 glycosylhydrolase n=1 Tax=Cohnella nanjingensis TaxID=1387779 RepID=A0A7X0VE15_9BACL|nr:family 43 glycosylhydrolase [Cohnella nanjingensis]MBB6670525.1 family 43 glycosylhydrolase [Cohnella nanjingensis]
MKDTAELRCPYENPVVSQRADPWIYKHTDGMYYFTGSVPAYDRIEIRRSPTIQGLGLADARVVWRKRPSGEMSSHIWAPEIHFIAGKWYIYFASAQTGANGEGLFDHRMYVLECASADPFAGDWTEKGQIKAAWESFSLDATSFSHEGAQYLVWAQRDPEIPGNSNLYLAEMENPWTVKQPQIMLTKPEFGWERIGFWVNEGPAVLKRNGRIFITYSASATNHHYCMGLLSASDRSDLLDPASWTKSPSPVFVTNEEASQYGPGHNCFTVSEDGAQDLLVYHARSYKEIAGDPLYDPNRHARVQPFGWKPDGTPFFGAPVPDGRQE